MTQTLQVDPIQIFYPNGGTSAAQMYVWDSVLHQPVLWDGAVTFSGTITIGAVSGNKSNNAVVPGSTNLGVLPAIANAAAQTWTEGRQVLLSEDLSGNLRVTLTTALPAGTNVIGHVITDTGSTTAVTGNVTVVQGTAANLNATVVIAAGSAVIGHVITDSGSTTAVTGTVTTIESAPTTVINGHKTIATAGSQAALAGSTTVKSVTVKALIANTGNVFVGDLNVDSSTGFQLRAGESVSLDIANLSTVFVDVSVNGEGVSYIAVN